ncbi:GtrA family protein [Solicola sp. PLA-1-18]|uniref:GtrA family protein n=1 Tax=Solicola sp. PLA-1-18 TaxID=3380532 RepID=UPI003B8241D9
MPVTGTRWTDLRHRAHRLAREVALFGMVGGLGFVTDVGLFNVLRSGEGALLADKPLTAKVVSVVVATVVTYVGNRQLTWRHRPRGDRRRELVLFFVFNGIGLAISVGALAVSHYLLGLTSPLADNIAANGVGLVLGTLFRFWAYRTFVFPPGEVADEDGPRQVEEDVVLPRAA